MGMPGQSGTCRAASETVSFSIRDRGDEAIWPILGFQSQAVAPLHANVASRLSPTGCRYRLA